MSKVLLFFDLSSKALAIVAFAISFFIVVTHPLFPVVATVFFLLYLFALFKYPNAWIFLLFALLPLFDFGMWTGNILYNEYDAFFLETLAVLFFRKNIKVAISFKYEALFFCFFIFFTVSIARGFWSYFDEFYNYDVHQSYLNSVRVGKGFLSAWFAWYFVRKQLTIDYENTVKLLGSGVLAGLFGFSLLIMWERHVFSSVLFGGSFYGVLSTILDFSENYRVTGFFSGMHVGGTAIDGYLICVLPLCFYAVSRKLNNYLWMLSVVILMLGIYCLIVTFTRMTIASGFFSLLVAVFMLIYQGKIFFERYRYSLLTSLLTLVVIVIGGGGCYRLTGYQGLMFGMFEVMAGVLIGHFFNKLTLHFFLLSILAVFFVGVFALYDSIGDSKWHQDVSSETAIIQAVGFAFLFVGLGVFLGFLLMIKNIPLVILRVPVVVTSVALFAIIGILSTRMEQRFKEVGQDLSTRKEHWLNVIDTRTPDSVSSSVLGEGMGMMVKQYYASNFNKKNLQSYTWSEQNGKTFLTLGANGYPFHQKIQLYPNTNYRLVAVIRPNSVGDALGIDICHKHILFSERWQPDCVKTSLVPKNIAWERVEWVFNSGNLGRLGWSDWPTTLQIHNYGTAPIDVDAVEIMDQEGVQIVKNQSFDNKLENWFWSSDFEHLPWHSKQLFIHIWLEQGWLGLLLFLFLLLCGLARQINLFLLGDPIPIAIIPSMVGIFGLGVTDTFIDEPQISLIVFFILFSAMQWPSESGSRSQARRVPA